VEHIEGLFFVWPQLHTRVLDFSAPRWPTGLIDRQRRYKLDLQGDNQEVEDCIVPI
jgi:hypothetical protein